MIQVKRVAARRRLVSGISGALALVFALLASPLQAQDGTSDSPPPAVDAATPLPVIPVAEHPDPPPPANNADKARGYTTIDEVIVTAQKRKERIQDVPVAVSVVGQEQLRAQGITQVDQLNRAVPAIEQNGETGNPQTVTAIRGIATFSFSPTAEQAVSFVADGVVLGKAPSVSLFDVSRIEVLRGPQGTLFGKNSSAGVINITSNAPDPSQFELIGHADFGFKYSKQLLQGVLNVPLGSDAAVRLSMGRSSEDGLLHNPVQNKDSEAWVDGGRLRLLWNILPELTLNVIGDYEKSYTSDLVYFQYLRYEDAQTGQAEPIPGCGGAMASYRARVACNNDPSFARQGSWGLSTQLDWTIEDYVLTSITAGRRYTQNSPIDPDGLPQFFVTNGNQYHNQTFSQELRIATPSGLPVEGVAGLYYSKAHVPNHYDQSNGVDLLASLLEAYGIPVAPCGQINLCLGDILSQDITSDFIADLKSMAAFGQLTYRFTDDWRWIFGTRVTHDVVAMNGNSVTSFSLTDNSLSGLLPSIPLGVPSATDRVNNISWRAGMQYDFDRDLMGYITASHGYKGPQLVYHSPNTFPINGGPNTAFISLVRPEYPMDYEAGLKATLFNGLFALNLNVFHNMIKDFQTFNFTLQGPIPTNVPHVITQGVELDFLGFLAPGLVLNGGLMYNKATYPDGYTARCQQVGPGCPNTNTLEDVGGKQIVAAPKFKTTLTTGYDLPLNSWSHAFLLTDVVYKTDITYVPYSDTYAHTGNHAVVGMRLGLRDPDQKWTVALFGRNLFNAYNPATLFPPYLLSQETSPGKNAVGFGISDESFRFFGVSIDGKF